MTNPNLPHPPSDAAKAVELARAALADDAKATKGPWESVSVMPAGSNDVSSWGESPWRLINGPPQVIQDEMLSRRAFKRREDTDWMEHARTREPILAAEVVRLRGLIEWHKSRIGYGQSTHHEKCLHLGCMTARGESAPGEG